MLLCDVNKYSAATAPIATGDTRHAAGLQGAAEDGTAADIAPGAAFHVLSVTPRLCRHAVSCNVFEVYDILSHGRLPRLDMIHR